MLDLTAQEREFAQAAREFADRELAPNAISWDQNKEFPVDTLRLAAEMGMGGLYVQPDVGGSGLSRLESALIIEALATGCPSVASYVSIHNMTAWMIDHYGNDLQRKTYLPQLCTMEHFGSYCLTEPGAGSDAAAVRTRAMLDGDDYILDGVKQFISGASTSSVYVVMARTPDDGPKSISAFIIEKDTPGLSFGPNEIKMGWNAQQTRQVVFEQVRVPASALLGGVGNGFKIAMHGLNGGRVNIAAASLGGASSALEKSLAYMSEREAFGQTLDSFQALRFQLADMATDLEAARLLLWKAASAIDAKDPKVVTWCAMAKKFVTDVSFDVANRALQLHGGYGYLAEYGIEKIVRDLRVHQILEGTNEIMRVIIARSLVGS